jgi:hypothetical protein
MTKIVLIIDANNLAHWLYNLPSKQITPAHCQLLVNQLIEYHNRYRARLADIELCFDREQEWQQRTPDFIRIFSATYPLGADDLVLDRFYFHNYHQQAHVVITNDEAIQNEIHADGGLFLSVYDFAQLTNTERPIFLSPADFGLSFPSPASPQQPQAAIPDLRHLSRRGLEETLAQHGYTLSEARASRRVQANPDTRPHPVPLPTPAEILPSAKPLEHSAKAPSRPPTAAEPAYRLTLDTWPVEAGVRFLLQSFCIDHRETFVTLIQEFDPHTMQSADLRVLAAYLISTCGEEPGFTRQGSLMDRIRLTLLKARGEPLPLSQIVSETGLNATGLQGRIKDKAAPWVEIIKR